MSDSALTMFIPFGAGYGNPGLTVRADTVDELKAIFAELSEQDDPEGASKLDGILDGVAVVNAGVLLKGLGSKPEPVAAKPVVTHPQAQSTPGDAPSCAHGPMKYKEGTGKSGKNYKAWFCPAPYGQTQCKPEFIN